MPKIDQDTKIIDNRVYGCVMHYTYIEPEIFEICGVKRWLNLTDDQAEELAVNCFHENAMDEDLDIEDIDWWY